MPKMSFTKPAGDDEAFAEAIAVVQVLHPPVFPEHAGLVSFATNHLINEHLMHQLDHLSLLIRPICTASAASTIIYTAFPPVIEALRRISHDLRGNHFEEHVYENGITAEDPEAMRQAWDLCQIVWGRAWMDTVAFLLKFGNVLIEEKRLEEVKGKGKAGVVEDTADELSQEEQMMEEGYEQEMEETRNKFDRTMEVIGVDAKGGWKDRGGGPTEHGVDDDNIDDDSKSNEVVEQASPVSKKVAPNDIDSHDIATAQATDEQDQAIDAASDRPKSHLSNASVHATAGSAPLSTQDDKTNHWAWDDKFNDNASAYSSSSQDSRRHDFAEPNPALIAPVRYPERLEAFGAALDARMRAASELRRNPPAQAPTTTQPSAASLPVNPYLANLASQANHAYQVNVPTQANVPYNPFSSVPVSQPASAPSPPVPTTAQASEANSATPAEGKLVRTLTPRKRPGHKRRERWVMEYSKGIEGW